MATAASTGQPAATGGRLQQLLRQYPLVSYFVITYAFSWLFLTPSVLSAWGMMAGDYTALFVVHTFGPFVASLIMVGVVEGKAGRQRLRQSVRQWRAGWPWYLFILAVIPALELLGIAIQPGAFANFQGLTPALLISYPLTFVAVWFGGGPLGEEVGWRGFALPRLQTRYGPLGGTLLLGVLWACWHLYEYLMPTQGGGPGTGLETFVTNFSLFLVLVLSLSVIMTWLYNHTRGSLFVAITAHASVNTPQLALLPLFPAMTYSGLLLAIALGFGVAALLIVVLTRGRLGYRPSEAQAVHVGSVQAQPTN